MKVIANNKKAYFNYFIKDTFEAGVALKGFEVKSIRAGNVSLSDSFVSIIRGEAFLKNAYIKPYEQTTDQVVNPRRARKLLLNKQELRKLGKLTLEKGFTIVPTKIYFNNKSLVKLEIAVAEGKHLYDKKQVLKDRDLKKQAQRELNKY